MLILTEQDILKAIDFHDLLVTTEKALLLQEEGGFFQPDRIHLEDHENIHLMMPAFEKDFASTKLVSFVPGNKKINKPSVKGLLVLQDNHTGEYLALLNGSVLTALRTGAVGALGLAYTSPKDIGLLGLIGAGVQGFHQALFTACVRNIREIRFFDPRPEGNSAFTERLSAALPGVRIMEETNVSELLKNSEAVITATTSSEPVIPDRRELLEGNHFVGIGSYRPGMREYPGSLYGLVSNIIIDTPLAKQESGDLAYPLEHGLIKEENIHTLGKLMNGSIQIDDTGTTFFKSVGMALFDLMAARAIYQKAKMRGIGTEINL